MTRKAARIDIEGFTLIELLMALVLVSILSVGAMNLFASRQGFSAFVFKNQLIAAARMAQQTALANQSSATPSSLTLTNSSGSISFTVNKQGLATPMLQYSEESSGTTISIDGVALGSHTFSWNKAADLTDGNNHNIQVSGQSSFTVCLSAAGFAYESSGVCP